MDRTFIGASKRLDDIDLPKLGHRIGVGEDEIHAFLDVETRGSGFDSLGRPLILFEPHVFYRNLRGEQRNEAVRQGLAYKNWGAKPYPKDSYPRLKAACVIDETAALKSASWGLGQVLGENHVAAGYGTVQDFVKAMMADEELQLEASINFIVANKLDDELRRHDWEGFARGYNGPGYRKNGYHTKLAEAFRKWSRIRDTPWKPGAETPSKPTIVAQVPIPPATEPVAAKVPAEDAAVIVAVPHSSGPGITPPPLAHPAGWGTLLALLASLGAILAKYLGVH